MGDAILSKKYIDTYYLPVMLKLLLRSIEYIYYRKYRENDCLYSIQFLFVNANGRIYEKLFQNETNMHVHVV